MLGTGAKTLGTRRIKSFINICNLLCRLGYTGEYKHDINNESDPVSYVDPRTLIKLKGRAT